MKFSVLGFRSDIRIKLRAPVVNPGRFDQRHFAPGRFAPNRFAPLVVLPLIDLPQEEKSTYFVEIYVDS